MDDIFKKQFRVCQIILGSILLLALTLTPWGIQMSRDRLTIVQGQVYASSGGGGGGHHAAPPFKYYVNWAVLLFAWATVFLYLKKKFSSKGHGDEHHEEHAAHEEHGGHGDDDDEGGGHHGIHVVQEAKGRAALVCGLVIFMFFVAYAPSLAGYHESVGVSAVKFVIQMTLGVGLTIFGILGMDEH